MVPLRPAVVGGGTSCLPHGGHARLGLAEARQLPVTLVHWAFWSLTLCRSIVARWPSAALAARWWRPRRLTPIRRHVARWPSAALAAPCWCLRRRTLRSSSVARWPSAALAACCWRPRRLTARCSGFARWPSAALVTRWRHPRRRTLLRRTAANWPRGLRTPGVILPANYPCKIQSQHKTVKIMSLKG